MQAILSRYFGLSDEDVNRNLLRAIRRERRKRREVEEAVIDLACELE